MIICDICGKEIDSEDWVQKRLLVKIDDKEVARTITFCRSCVEPLNKALARAEAETVAIYLRERNPKLLEKLRNDVTDYLPFLYQSKEK